MSTDSSASETHTTGELIERLYQELDDFGGTFGAVAGVLLIVFLMQLVVDYSSRVHWLLAAIPLGVFLLLVAWYSRLARRPPLASTRGMAATYLMLGLSTAVVFGSWVSYTLYQLGIGRYEVQAASSLDSFIRLYFFTLADLIPALKITETLHLSSPIEARDYAAGLPVLGFRIFVLWFVFDAFRHWRKSRKDAGKEKSSDMVMFVMFLLIFVVVVLRKLQ